MPPKMTRKQAKLAGNVYRGYIPPDLPQHRPRNPIKPWWKVIGRPRHDVYPEPELEEWTEEPEYPPVFDASKAGLKRQFRLDWYESLKLLPTPEQKLYHINEKYRHRIAHINNWLPTSNPLSFTKYLTQTHLIDNLPVGYDIKQPSSADANDQDLGQITGNKCDLPRIRQLVLDQVAFSKHESQSYQSRMFISKQIRDGNRAAHVSNRLVESIVNQVRKTLVYETNPQLLDYQIDLSPAIRSWWYHSGFEPWQKKAVFFKSRKDSEGNVSTIFQMDGSSALNIRGEHMMEPMVDMNDAMVTDTSLVEKMNYDARHFGAMYKWKWPVALPGFWFEDTPRYDCPHTCFLSTDCLDLRKQLFANAVNSHSDEEECLTSQAIMTAFGWLNGLSMYHGYTPYNEIHYPFTCQVVTTDGQNWMFSVFQMNSHAFHRDLGGPARNNICWSSGLMKLYDNYQGGNFEGVNDDVISLLVKFMSKQLSPEYTSQLNMRPYIHEDTRTQEEKEKSRKDIRDQFENRYNRWLLHNWTVPEWEKIFFRLKATRHQITHMKPQFHIPRPKPPKEFE